MLISVCMKRPAAKPAATAKRPAAAKKPAACEQPKKKPKKVLQDDLLLQILFISGEELLQLKARTTWTTRELKKAVMEELAKVKKGRLDKLVPVGQSEPIPEGQTLEAAGLHDGCQIYAILHKPVNFAGSSVSEGEESEEDFYSFEDDPFFDFYMRHEDEEDEESEEDFDFENDLCI